MKNKVLSILALLICGFAGYLFADDRPNIVILFADDMGYGDLGSYGNPYIRTPNLDRLAAEGQRWTDFYVAAPVCSPSRGALLTGQLPVRSGLYGETLVVMFPDDSHGIPTGLVTLAEALRAAGYRTGMFGKWHLGDAPDNYPTRNGFDYWYGVPYSNDMNVVGGMEYDELLNFIAKGETDRLGPLMAEEIERFKNPRSEYWDIPLYRSEYRDGAWRDELIERPLQQETFTRRLTGEAVQFIREAGEAPFLVYLPYSMPHLPVFASEAFAGKSLRGAYGDAVEEIDWSVGRIRATLEELGIAGNTLVLFTSDNGPWQQMSTFRAGSAGPLRGSKGTVWEGGVREPGIFWWPGKIAPGVVSDIGTTMDVYATALRLAGAELPPGTDGLDLSPALFHGSPAQRSEMPYYQRGTLMAYRKGPYKIVLSQPDSSGPPLEHPLLFDLRQDIGEVKDISVERPDLLKDLLQAVETHRARVKTAPPIFDMRLDRKSEGEGT